jgi:hypothetical protein
MPILAMFYGIIIRMFYKDNKEHFLPHIHVEYAEHKIVISIPDGEVLTWSLPKAQLKFSFGMDRNT